MDLDEMVGFTENRIFPLLRKHMIAVAAEFRHPPTNFPRPLSEVEEYIASLETMPLGELLEEWQSSLDATQDMIETWGLAKRRKAADAACCRGAE